MSMFIFPFGFYMVHFFYTYSVAIWGTNFSLHETEFVPCTNSLGTWVGAFQWKENWWYFTYCDDLCDASPSARGVREPAEVVPSLDPAPPVPKDSVQLSASFPLVLLTPGPFKHLTRFILLPSSSSLVPACGSDLISTSQDTAFLTLFI